MLSIRKILVELCSKPTCSVPFAGMVLGELSKNPSYDAAVKGTLGVPVIDTGGKKRVPSIAVLRRLGFDDDAIVAAIVGQDTALTTAEAAETVEAVPSSKVAASVAKTAAVKTAEPKRRRNARSSNKAAA